MKALAAALTLLALVGCGEAQKAAPVLNKTDFDGCKFAAVLDNHCARVYHARGEWAGGAMLVAQHIFPIEGIQHISANTPHEWRVVISPLYSWDEVHPKIVEAMREARDAYYEQKQAEEKEAATTKRKQGA